MSPSERISPLWVGVACGVLSAVGYTAANTCLRAVTHCDPVWVSTVKAFPTLALFGPWLLVLKVRGERIFPSWRVLASLAAAALLAHVGGNVLFQWSLGVIGLALAVPITLGAMILGGATLGRLFLHEGITSRAVVANALLLAAICILSLGAGQTQRAVPTATVGVAAAWVGVLAAFFCGTAYATLGVVIRYSVSGEARISTTIVYVSAVGLLALSLLTEVRIGVEGMLATAPRDLAAMAMAGVFNAVAFLSLTKALQLTSVMMVNALNASQTAMALAAGVVLFEEPLTQTLAVGVFLTILGLLLMSRRGKPIAE